MTIQESTPTLKKAKANGKVNPKSKRYTDEKIAEILAREGGGQTVNQICDEYGISTYSFYRWREKARGGPKKAKKTKSRRKFTEEYITKILAEEALGKTPKQICKEHGLADSIYYKWRMERGKGSKQRAKARGMLPARVFDSEEAVRLRVLEVENAKLRKLLGATFVEYAMLKE